MGAALDALGWRHKASLLRFLKESRLLDREDPVVGLAELLETHGTAGRHRLPAGSASRYQRTIVRHRNRYMYEAGTYPAREEEIRALLGEMQSCMALVVLL